MYKRNQHLRKEKKLNNKIQTLIAFMLKGCLGVKYNLSGMIKVQHATTLALNHFIRKESA